MSKGSNLFADPSSSDERIADANMHTTSPLRDSLGGCGPHRADRLSGLLSVRAGSAGASGNAVRVPAGDFMTGKPQQFEG